MKWEVRREVGLLPQGSSGLKLVLGKKLGCGLGKLRQERKAKLVLSTVMSDLSDMEL